MREKVLLITRNLPPLVGGMERLVHRIALSLSEEFELTVIGPIGCGAFLPAEVRVRVCQHRSLPAFLLSAASSVRGLDARYDMVLAGSGLTAPLALCAAARSRVKWAVYLHGLDIIAPSWIYQHLWLPCIRRSDMVLVNSRNTRDLAIAKGIDAGRIDVLHPGTEVPGADLAVGRRFRDKHDLGECPVMLSVGRFTPRKGLVDFIEKSMPQILSWNPDSILLVIGADANDAVRSSGNSERNRILESARTAGVARSIRMLPACDDSTLSSAYRAADAHVFPVLDIPGDVEGFGMVAIEPMRPAARLPSTKTASAAHSAALRGSVMERYRWPGG